MKILVAYDGSGPAKNALALAAKYAKSFDAKVYVMTSMKGGPSEKPDDIKKAESELEHAKSVLDAAKISYDARQIVRGLEPGEDIVRFSKENAIDVILVGIEKKSRVGKFVFGSTAQYVILEAECPVVSVK
ncbi:MAG: universal stress protein [Desulfobacterales bacterium]|nr:universal stress protein [Desulfobacterales bacterium]